MSTVDVGRDVPSVMPPVEGGVTVIPTVGRGRTSAVSDVVREPSVVVPTAEDGVTSDVESDMAVVDSPPVDDCEESDTPSTGGDDTLTVVVELLLVTVVFTWSVAGRSVTPPVEASVVTLVELPPSVLLTPPASGGHCPDETQPDAEEQNVCPCGQELPELPQLFLGRH